MKTLTALFFYITCLCVHGQNIPTVGSDSTLEIANWNIEWLGSTGNGPSNENLQLKNAVSVLSQANIDLWGLCEISSAGAWDSIKARLPEYGGAISTYGQEQKTALLFRKSMFTALYQKHPLVGYEDEFASGRLPLEVGLEFLNNGQKDTLYVFVIHLKANTGNSTQKEDAWVRRKKAGELLKSYIDASGHAQRTIVIGDWNDDIDQSVFDNYSTPFLNWVADSSRYFFPSRTLSLSSQRSTASYTEMIDHQCVSASLSKYYIQGSAHVFYLQTYINSYSTNTSDHYPVFSLFSLNKWNTAGITKPQVEIPKPYFNGDAILFTDGVERTFNMFDLSGRKLEVIEQVRNVIVVFDYNGRIYTNRILINRK